MLNLLFFLFLCLKSLSSIDIYTDSSSSKCLQNCDGSISKPFPTLLEALNYIQSQSSLSTTNLFLNSLGTYEIPDSTSNQINYFFQNKNSLDLTIQPKDCPKNGNSCNNINAKIEIKGEKNGFMVNKALVFYHIDLIGKYSENNNNYTIVFNPSKSLYGFIIYELISENQNLQFLNCNILNFKSIGSDFSFNFFIGKINTKTNGNDSLLFSNSSIENFYFINGIVYYKNNNFGLNLNNIKIFNTDEINGNVINRTDDYQYLFNLLGNNNKLIFSNNTNFTNIDHLIKTQSFSYFEINNISISQCKAQNKSLRLFSFENSNNFLFFALNISTITNYTNSVFYFLDSNIVNISNSTFSTFKFPLAENPILFFKDSNKILLLSSSFSDISTQSYGGLLQCSEKNEIIVNNSKFINVVAFEGGFFFMNRLNILDISFSFFDSGSTTLEGGVLYMHENNTLKIYQTTMQNSKAWKGGALYCNLSTILFIDRSLFVNNQVFSLGNRQGGTGGVLSVNKTSDVKIHNSVFHSNFAKFEGGALFMNFSNVNEIYNCNFTYNQAGDDWNNKNGLVGGAIGIDYGLTTNISKCQFLNNQALKFGGAIYYYSYDIDIIDCIFVDSFAETGASVFLNQDVFGRIINTNIVRSNSWYGFGGFLYCYLNNNLTVINATILDANKGNAGWGGAIYLDNGNKFHLENIQITNSRASIQGGAFYLDKNNKGKFINLILDKIISVAAGGCFYFGSFNNIEIIDSKFTNIAAQFGGGFHVETENTIIMKNSEIGLSIVTARGAAIYSNSKNNINVDNGKFYDLFAPDQSGTIELTLLNTAVFNNCLFNNSRSRVSGTGYFINTNTITITNSILINQTSWGFGGSFGVSTTSTMTLKNVSFINTICETQDGGVILSENNNNKFYITNCSFINTFSGANGGVFSFGIQNIIEIDESLFYNNSVSGTAGGAIIINNNNDFTITNSNFTYTRLLYSGGGGAIAVSQENYITILNCRFENITSFGDGGVMSIYLENFITLTNVFIKNVHIKSAISKEGSFLSNSVGGCFFFGQKNEYAYLTNIYVYNVSTQYTAGFIQCSLLNIIVLENIYIEMVSVKFAAAFIYVEDQNFIQLTNGTIINISSNLFGAGIYSLFENIIVMSSLKVTKINNNGSSGGFAYFKDLNKVQLNDSSISDVFCFSTGGIIYAELNNFFEFFNNELSNIRTRDSGSVFYLIRNNDLKFINGNGFNINSIFRGTFFYAVGKNIIKVENSTFKDIRGLADGCFLYFENLNNITMNTSYIFNATCEKYPSSIFYFEDQNQINLTLSKFENPLDTTNARYFEFFRLNLINFTKITANIAYMLHFIYLDNQNTLLLKNIFVDKNSLFNTFIYGNNINYIRIKHFNVKFRTLHAFLHLKESKANLSYIFIQPTKRRNINATDYMTDILSITQIENDLQRFYQDFVIFYFENCNINLKNIRINNPDLIYLNPFRLIRSQVYINNTVIMGMSSKHSGSVGMMIDSELILNNNVFLNCKSEKDGGVFDSYYRPNDFLLVDSSFKIEMNKNKFQFNQAYIKGGVLNAVKQNRSANVKVTAKNNYYSFNKGWQGGVFNFENIYEVNFFNNTFYKNKAIKSKKFSNLTDYLTLINLNSKGGVIYFDNKTGNKYFNNGGLNITRNVFNNNIAEIGGSIYSIQSLPSVLNLNNFSNNTGIFFGNDVASLMKKISFLPTDTDYKKLLNPISSLTLTNLASGQIYSECVALITGLDEFNNVGFKLDKDDNIIKNLKITQISPDQKLFSSLLNYELQNGQICFNSFIRNEIPLEKSFTYNITYKDFDNILELKISFRNCQIGERLSDDYRCVPCDPGSYSFQTQFLESFSCVRCSESLNFICLGGNKLSPKEGYWRVSEQSENFLKCPKQESCVPYNKTLYDQVIQANDTQLIVDISNVLSQSNIPVELYTGSCEPGYSGPFCNICEENYGKMGKLNCILCSDSSWFYYLLIVVQIVLKVVYLFYCVIMAFKMIIAITMKEASESAVVAINLLKILVIHIQLMSFILKMPFDWSTNLQTYLPILFSFSPDISEAFSFECFMKSLGWTIPQQYFILILVPIYILLLFLFCLIFVSIKKSMSKNRQTQALSSAKLGICVFLIIIILTYIDLSKINLEMFQCINISNPNTPDNRLVNDVEIECDSLYHNLWKYVLTVPILVFCVIVIIFILIRMGLSYYRQDLEKNDTKLEFGYFYFAYKRKYFYWDFIILLRRLLILFFFLFFYQEMISKNIMPILYMILVLLGSLALQIYVKPFEENYNIVNEIEKGSLIVLSFSYIIALMYGTFYFEGYEIEIGWFLATVLGILLINIIYIIVWAKIYYDYYLHKKLKSFVGTFSKIILNSQTKILEKMQQEHHIIRKIEMYLAKKKYLLPEINDSGVLTNEMYDYQCLFANESNFSVFTKIYSRLMENVNMSKNKTIMNQESVVKASEIMYSELRNKILVKNLNQKHEISIKLEKNSLKSAYLDEEVVFFEDLHHEFKVTYKKILKGKNNYNYHMINFVKVISKKRLEIMDYYISPKKDIMTSIRHNKYDSEDKFVDEYVIHLKSFAVYTDSLDFYLKLGTIDSFMTTLKVRLPLTVLFFTKFLNMSIMEKYLDIFSLMSESLLTRTYYFKNSNSPLNLIKDIGLIFPNTYNLRSKHTYVEKYIGLFSILSLPNAIFTYVIKINDKLKKFIIEILVIPKENYNRIAYQKIAYNLAQNIGYLVVNGY